MSGRTEGARDRRARLRRPAGERLCRCRFPRRRRRGYAVAGEALLETGVTAYLPTFITSDEADLIAALGAVPARAPRARAFSASISRARSSPRGTPRHTSSRCRRDPDPRCSTASSTPARPSHDAGARAPRSTRSHRPPAGAGVVVSLGHSDATAADAQPRSTAAFVPSRMSSTRCVRSAHRDPGSSAPPSSARTSCCR